MNQEQFENIIEHYIENGMYPDTCPENIKDFINEEVTSLHTLKMKLQTQRFAINNLLSIIDRCEDFGIVNEVLDEPIQYPKSSIPGSEIDYSHFFERMVKAITKNKYNVYINFSNIERIDIDSMVIEFQDEYGYVDSSDVNIEEADNVGCSNTLSCQNIRDRL